LEKIVFTTSGGVTAFQVAKLDPTGKPQFDQSEAFVPAGTWGFERIYGITLRSRDAGTLATIDPITGYFDDDPDPYNPGNIPTTATAITGTVNVDHNGALIGTRPTINFIDSADASFAVTVADNAGASRVDVTFPNAVTSFNGRDGVVVPTTGDYLASQVTNAADKASASTQFFTSAVFVGANAALPTTLSGAGISNGVLRLVTIGTGNTGIQMAVANNADTQNRFTVTGDGTHGWGSGTAVTDTSLFRSTTNPPSGTAVGLQTNNPMVVNDPNGFKVIQVANSSAFSVYGVNTDANPLFKIFAQGAMEWGPGGASALDMELARVTNSPTGTGTFLELITLLSAFGYGTGLGGSVTLVSGGTATLNKASGKLTAPSAIASGGQATYTVSNTLVGAQDVIILNLTNGVGGTGAPYSVSVNQVNAGSFVFNIVNNSGVSITPTFNFALFKAASS